MKAIPISGDGAKWGVSDWYDEVRHAIEQELAKGPRHKWTTGWYSVKKEIQAGLILCENGTITCEASVRDDFDTEGYGKRSLAFATDLDAIAAALDDALEQAEQERESNECYIGYKVMGKCRRHGARGHYMGWVETYIMPAGEGAELESPPGDHYRQWGWQGERELPKDVARRLESWIVRHAHGATKQKQFTCKGFTVMPWGGK